ncbi:MAG: hypothetical protein V1784_08195 [bacterium]
MNAVQDRPYLWPGKGELVVFFAALALLIIIAIRWTGLGAFRTCTDDICVLHLGRLLGFYVLSTVVFYFIYCWVVWGWKKVTQPHRPV